MISTFTLLTSNAVNSRRDKSMFFNRSFIFAILYSSTLGYELICLSFFLTGVGLFARKIWDIIFYNSYSKIIYNYIYNNAALYFFLAGLSSCFILLGTTLTYVHSDITLLYGHYRITGTSNISNYFRLQMSYLYDFTYLDISLLIMSVAIMAKISILLLLLAKPGFVFELTKKILFIESIQNNVLSNLNKGNTLTLMSPHYVTVKSSFLYNPFGTKRDFSSTRLLNYPDNNPTNSSNTNVGGSAASSSDTSQLPYDLNSLKQALDWEYIEGMKAMKCDGISPVENMYLESEFENAHETLKAGHHILRSYAARHMSTASSADDRYKAREHMREHFRDVLFKQKREQYPRQWAEGEIQNPYLGHGQYEHDKFLYPHGPNRPLYPWEQRGRLDLVDTVYNDNYYLNLIIFLFKHIITNVDFSIFSIWFKFALLVYNTCNNHPLGIRGLYYVIQLNIKDYVCNIKYILIKLIFKCKIILQYKNKNAGNMCKTIETAKFKNLRQDNGLLLINYNRPSVKKTFGSKRGFSTSKVLIINDRK